MRLFEPFRVPAFPALWAGQAFAAIGAEFYSVALVWTAADILATQAGYISAVHAGVILVGAFLSGYWADLCRRSTAMVAADVLRAGTALFLGAAYGLGAINAGVLIGAAALVALATAVFDPALQASIPALIKEPQLRHQANSLFDATKRMARILSPVAIAAVASIAPKSYLFAITGLAFLGSLTMTLKVRPALDADGSPAFAAPGLVAGMRLVLAERLVIASLAGLVVSNFTWGLGMLLGMALFLRQTSPTPLGDYGLIMAAYGVGNLATNLWLASQTPQRPAVWLIVSKLTFGIGICLLPFADSLATAMIIAAFAATNGPLENLAVLHLVQSRFPLDRLRYVFRIVLGATFGGLFIAYAASPVLFALYGLRPMIVAAGALSLGAGVLGLVAYATVRHRQL
ncbi:MFS transporter (plasmid) [Agrobacterium sp. rho-13.3]